MDTKPTKRKNVSVTQVELPAMRVQGVLKYDDVLDIFEMFESKNMLLTRMDMCAAVFRKFRSFGRQVIDEATHREVMTSHGLFGHLYTADLHIDNRVPPNQIACYTQPFKSMTADEMDAMYAKAARITKFREKKGKKA